MRRYILLLLVLVTSVTCMHAQEPVELFGYFESQMMGARLKKDFYQLYTNKLRMDLLSRLTGRITFRANFDYITYHGKQTWNILDFLVSDITEEIPEDMAPFYIFPFQNRNFLDNAYIKIALENLDITIGKQQISLGSGYVWNPTDLFNIKDVLDPTYEQPGHNALRLDIPIGNRYTFTTLYSPDDVWKNSSKLIQLKGGISHMDYTLIAIEKIWHFHDYLQFDQQRMNFIELPERRRLFGASTEGELFGLGIWAEYGYSEMERTKDFYELVFGLNYTFDFQTFVMAEFYRNTLAKKDYHDYTINDWMRQFAAEQKSISRDQVYFLIQHPVSDFVNLGSSGIFSISDGSFALVPTLNYSFSQNMDIMAYLNLNFGKDGTAYSKLTGSGGLLRARIYF